MAEKDKTQTNGWDVLKTLILTVFRFIDRGHLPALVLLLVFSLFAYHSYRMPSDQFFAMCKTGLAKSVSAPYAGITVVVGTYIAFFFACKHLLNTKAKEIERLASERDELKRLLEIKIMSSGHKKGR